MAARRKLKKRIKKIEATFAAAIAAAFGFVMALAWNEALKAIVDQLLVAFGLTGKEYIYKFMAAIVVTIIAIVGIWIVSKWKE